MNSDSLAILLLTNRLIRIDEKPFTAREFWKLVGHLPNPEAILTETATSLVRDFGLSETDADRVKRLGEHATGLTFEIERLEESGIRVLTYLDEDFPVRVREVLGDRSSAFLLVAGNLDLLNQQARGIVGSRNIDETAIDVAQSAANHAVKIGNSVVSGLAKGVDRIAMSSALEADGSVIGVPSEGLRSVARGSEVRNLVHEGKICLVSPYGPDVRFSVGNAMGRNRFVYAISTSTLVVASDVRKGGTWAGAEEALKYHFSQVDVWTGEGASEGNFEIQKLGARPVTCSDEFWTDDFQPSTTLRETTSEQLKLF